MSATPGSASRRVVGLTGSFGSGKSTVGRMFRRLGAKVLDADRLAHETYSPSHGIYPKIRRLFPEIQGRLTRTRVAEIVFKDTRRRRQLESLIHPYVDRRIREELARISQGVVVLEVPLLFEAGLDRRCDATVVVQARPQQLIARLKHRGFSVEGIEQRWRAQMPLAKKLKRADYVVDNSGTRQTTLRQVRGIWNDWHLKGVE